MSVGPYSVHVVAVAIAALLAWLVARAMQRGQPGNSRKTAANLLLDALLVGLIGARAGYVLRWWPEYNAAPASIVAIGDGGFTWWVGLPVALVFVWWKSRQAHALRRPALAGVAAGMLVWGMASGALTLVQHATQPLPALQVLAIDGTPVSLNSYAGKPIVLNLWATWCPPCRREMPMLAKAQSDYPGVTFLMVNQGEEARALRAFLEQQDLKFSHVLLDASSKAMQTYGSRGLPTTLFFDAQGKLVDSHMGELTAARLKEAISRHVQP